MLSIGIFTILVAIPIFSYKITPNLWNRITTIILLYSALLSLNGLHIESLASGVGIYSGLFTVNILSISTEIFILFIGSIIILGWAPINYNYINKINNIDYVSSTPTISEYSILILFTCIGSTILISSSDLISIYLSLELQSFGVYVLATIYRNSESSTSAGLKYFLLGGLSSAFILLGTSIIYAYTGLTQFESIYSLIQVWSEISIFNANNGITWAILFIGVGFLFKISAAPLHNWAPDVYDGVPTIISIWLTTIPKISLLIFLFEIQSGLQGSFNSLSITINSIDFNTWKNLLLISSILSLIIGTIVGLSQKRIKRLLAYSTISHIGFILLSLAINTEQSIESFIFYIAQYSISNITIFLILLAFGYINKYKDIENIDELKGQFKINPILSFSISICLFSIAGIPPIIGFFAKQIVLYSSIINGYYFISIIAIIVSVISASYYLKIIRVIFFDNPNNINNNKVQHNDIISISNIHSFFIAIFTIIITLFVIKPTIILNSTQLLALSIFIN